MEKGGKFEDLNQISRPTELIRSFNTLYSQLRIDALDALDSIRELSSADDLKSKLLFSVVVVREDERVKYSLVIYSLFSLLFVMHKITRKMSETRLNSFYNYPMIKVRLFWKKRLKNI